jgi:beta-galactosidase
MPYATPAAPNELKTGLPSANVAESDNAFTITGKEFTARIGKKNGALESYVLKGRELLTAPLVPNYWRNPTDNDRGNGMPIRQAIWKDAATNRIIRSVTRVQTAEALVKIVVVADVLEGKATQTNTYTFDGNGAVEVESAFKLSPRLVDMPCYGMQMRISGDLRNVTWFGRGPHENYWDRQLGAAVGRYSDVVDNLWFPYVQPQETGNRTDVRWVSFTNAKGFGFKVTGMPTVDFRAWPFHMEELEHYKPPSTVGHRHTSEVVMAPDITVNIDYRQMGVGGDNSWGAQPHPEFRLSANEYKYAFRLAPVFTNSANEAARIVSKARRSR